MDANLYCIFFFFFAYISAPSRLKFWIRPYFTIHSTSHIYHFTTLFKYFSLFFLIKKDIWYGRERNILYGKERMFEYIK